MQQKRAHSAQVVQWMKQYDINESGKLERDELCALLSSLHPDSPPDARALDLLITQATEIQTYSMSLKGDPNGAVGPDSLMAVTCGYATYVLASAAFNKLDTGGKGIIALRDLPSLMREASEGLDCDNSDVEFVMDSLTENASVNGLASTIRDDASSVSREELIPAFAAWKIAQLAQENAAQFAGRQPGAEGDPVRDPAAESGVPLGAEVPLGGIQEQDVEDMSDGMLDPSDWLAADGTGPESPPAGGGKLKRRADGDKCAIL